MVAERPLHGTLLGRIDIALDHEVAVGRHPQLVGQTLHQPHAAAAQKTRQKVLVHVVGHGRRGGIGIDRIAAQRHRHGHAAPQTPAGVEVPGTGLVHVPVHARGAVVEELHAVHARIAHARFGIDRVHDGQRHEPPPVAGPAAQHGQRGERGRGTRRHDLLACAPAAHLAGQPARHLGQQGQRAQLVEQRIAGARGLAQQRADPRGHGVERLGAERHRTAALRTVEVRKHGKRRARILEQQRLAAAGALRHAVRNLRYFIFGIDPHRDAGQLAGAFEPRHIFSQVPIHLFRRIAPAADRTGTAATAARSPRRTGASGAGMGQRYAFRPEIGTARPLFRPAHPRTGANCYFCNEYCARFANNYYLYMLIEENTYTNH